ncbi:MAG: Stp1/IreP family PP2C-type Ser/Thr phosphatase [Waddliaceae bacterium]
MVKERGTKLNYSIIACGNSDMGLVRENNEDAWAIEPKDNIFILADGMGGHCGGEVAAKKAVESFSSLMKSSFGLSAKNKTLEQTCEQLRRLIQQINISVHQKGQNDRELHGMGTTLCCVYFHEEGLIHAHVGDSRIYQLREKKLHRLTEDHSLVSDLLKMGQLNARQAQEHAFKNVITKAIGTQPRVEPTVKRCKLAIGDQYMMCSDGLSDLLSQKEIEQIMNQSPSLEKTVKRLILAANRQGGHDNITVVLMKVQSFDDRYSRY